MCLWYSIEGARGWFGIYALAGADTTGRLFLVARDDCCC